MNGILELYSLHITAIQMNSVPIKTLPKENITLRIVELGSEDFDENCDTINADVTQMDASLQPQQYHGFPWPRLQLTQMKCVLLLKLPSHSQKRRSNPNGNSSN
ncbi:hypothetical protein WMY93_010211 [Mugilogobius chulae]|uniref:Uncharacterized protein n=1 Tax=Mugilogobius chulae TaxID=88201 RepID=A0AAW0PAF2_9GOBI